MGNSSGRATPLAHLQQVDSGILVASFLVGPFVQQASRTTECSSPVPGLTVSIRYAHYVPGQGDYFRNTGIGTGAATADTIVALLSSVTGPIRVENQTVPSCTSGKCTFTGDHPEVTSGKAYSDLKHSTHSTVGMCASVLTHDLLYHTTLAKHGWSTIISRTASTQHMAMGQ